MRTVAEKMGLKEYSRAILINPPEGINYAISLPEMDLSENLIGEFDYIHLFIKHQSELEEIFPKLKSHLNLDGMLWVSWPKGKQLGTDLCLQIVIKTGYEFGLVESICLSLNETWSALKFTHPKKGKVYCNSHATLKERTTNR